MKKVCAADPVNPGFNPEHSVDFQPWLPASPMRARQNSFYQEVVEHLRSVPGGGNGRRRHPAAARWWQ